MSLRFLTPLLALMITSQLSAGDSPDGDRPQGPPPETLFERFDQNGDQLLSRPEFVRGMFVLQHLRLEGGDQERPRRPNDEGDGRAARPPREGDRPRPRPENGDRPPRPPGEGEDRPRPENGDRPRPEDARVLEKALGAAIHARLEKNFDEGDADKGGTLTLEEFRVALQSALPPPANRPGQGEGDRPRPAREK